MYVGAELNPKTLEKCFRPSGLLPIFQSGLFGYIELYELVIYFDINPDGFYHLQNIFILVVFAS